jgi:hypothetical protein
MTNNLRALDACLALSVTGLFDEWGYGQCQFYPCTQPATWGDAVVAAIGFTAKHARGSISLVMTPDVARALSTIDGLRPADIVGEFCNMALGRMKNRLLASDVVLNMALPTVASGVDVSVGASASGDSLWHVAQMKAGSVLVRLDAVFDPEFRIGTIDASVAADVGREGDCLIF